MQLSDHVEQLVVTAAQKTTIGGGIVAAASGVSEKTGLVEFLGTYSSEIASGGVLAGTFFGFTGVIVQLVFNYLRNRREAAEHKKRMGE